MNLSTVAAILSRIMWPSALLPSSWHTRLTLSSVLSVTSGTSRGTVTSLNARSSGSTRSSRDPRRSRGTLRSAARGAFRVLLWTKRTIQKCFLYHFDKDLSGEWRNSISMFSCMYKIVTKKIHLRKTLEFPECSNLFSFNVRALYPEEIWLVRNTDGSVETEQSIRILSEWWTIRPCSLWRNMRSRKNDRAKQIS